MCPTILPWAFAPQSMHLTLFLRYFLAVRRKVAVTGTCIKVFVRFRSADFRINADFIVDDSDYSLRNLTSQADVLQATNSHLYITVVYPETYLNTLRHVPIRWDISHWLALADITTYSCQDTADTVDLGISKHWAIWPFSVIQCCLTWVLLTFLPFEEALNFCFIINFSYYEIHPIVAATKLAFSNSASRNHLSRAI